MEKDPIITIGIPTYHRHEQLKTLYNDFLSKVEAGLRNYVEIIVTDNSDTKIAKCNKNIFADTSVRYLKNETNVGFSGNILNCVKQARGRFLWLISDDDDVDYRAFSEFVDYLIDLRDEDIKCVMLPFINKNFLGDQAVYNTPEEWGVQESTTLLDMVLNSRKLPFILFSSAVVRLEGNIFSLLDQLDVEYHDNDYMQIVLFLEIIGISSRVIFYASSLQTYNQDYEIRFNINSMQNSYRAIIKKMCQENPEIKAGNIIIRDDWRWLGLSLWSYMGFVSVPGEPENRHNLLVSVFKTYSLKNIILSSIFFIPADFLRKIYIVIFSLKSAYRNNDLTFNGIKSKIKLMNNIGK